MTCLHDAQGNHVGDLCDGGPKTFHRTMHRCPFCHRLRPIAGFSQEWYGTTWICLGCGDSWSGDEMLPRPFTRGWRKASIWRARHYWDLAGLRTRPV